MRTMPWEDWHSKGFHRGIVMRYAVALCAVAGAYFIRHLVDPILGDRSALEMFLVAVAFAAWFGGCGPAITAMLASAVIGAWSFVPPRKALGIHETADRVEAGAFLFAALAISWLVRSLRRSQDRAEANAHLAESKQSALSLEVRQRTEAERTVQILADENERRRRELETVLDAAPVAIWVAHDRDCRQVTGNRLAHAVFGEWEGSGDVAVRVGGSALSPQARPLFKAASTGQPALGTEFELVAWDGTTRWMLSNAVPLVGDKGGVQGAVSIWSDVTGLKKAEEKVRRLNEDLEHRVENRTEELRRALDELSSYAYSIAHDLRAPLRAMAGLTTLLVEETRDRLPSTGAEYARRIVEAAKQMDEMVLDLLRYSRISRESYPIQQVGLQAICADAVSGLSRELQAHSAEVAIDGPMSTVLGHQDLVRECIVELISNALKFVSPSTAPRIRVWAETTPTSVRIWVEDNGIGIPPAYRDTIFGVFQRLHRREEYPGTGMGLAIVRRAVERMEGRCGVESAPDRGSRFWFELPAVHHRPDGSPAVLERSHLKF